MAAWRVVCRACGATGPVDALWWACPTCGGLLDIEGPVVDPTPAPGAPWSLWRYGAALPPLGPAGSPVVTMGEGMTPLVASGAPGVWLKMDHVMPTLSFKDRGAAVLLSAAAASGVEAVVADSSGNAGISVAAYAARAGIAATVYVPAATGGSKRAAIERVGGRVVVVEGDRAAAADAARDAVTGPGAPVYASHVHQPLFTQGTKTFAYECWEQLGGAAPGTVVVPTGNGTLLLGAATGFADLLAAGLIERAPVLVAVQAERCAPVVGAAPVGPTAAEGIAIAAPPRLAQLREAADRVVLAEEADIAPARAGLGAAGVDVEPTSAATWAAWTRHAATDEGAALPRPVVVALCGAGLKSP